MIPRRFVAEYPDRCMELLAAFESSARDKRLVGSFALTVASSIFLVPYERMKEHHPLGEGQNESALRSAIRDMEKRTLFQAAPFWDGMTPGDWRFTRITKNVTRPNEWRDEDERHPVAKNAANTISRRKSKDVLRVMRNGLAHGNVVYLNRAGREDPNTELHYLAFLSRYEESKEDRDQAETYRLVVTKDDDFLKFVKAWGRWLQRFPPDDALYPVAAE